MQIQLTTFHQTTTPSFGKIGKVGKLMGRGRLRATRNPYLEKLDKLDTWYQKEVELIYRFHQQDMYAIQRELKNLDLQYYQKLEQLEGKYGKNVSWLRRLFGI